MNVEELLSQRQSLFYLRNAFIDHLSNMEGIDEAIKEIDEKIEQIDKTNITIEGQSMTILEYLLKTH